MNNLLSNRSYPFFLGPEEHGLPAYYRRLNRFAFAFSPLIFVVNEFFIRPDLSVYKKTPEALWSIIALTLNSEIPTAHTMPVIAAIALYSACLGINVYMLPKWGPRAAKVGMKSGLPTNAEYAIAYFQISNRIEKMAFTFWNSIFVPVSFFFASFLPCMFVNLIRSLS
jgi:hypothetical protein